MSYLVNAPEEFAEEAAQGLAEVHAGLLRRVPGGVARRTTTPDGQVAVVVGGGSGHYPAFAGLVGPGLAHAAAMGNVFASPSSQQVYSVAKSVATDAGVLLCYGNYAGDRLNFDLAQDRLRREGIPCHSVRVTDDICSATPDERDRRRGIAGDLAVFRVAAWAAEQGRDLAGVAALAARANARTCSLGIAFSGCTLPGAAEPLFTVPAGQMAVGMGIHGEPGIEVRPLARADEIAALLVDRVLEESTAAALPTGRARVAVIVNGLGAVKSEELLVVYRAVARLLRARCIEIVEPEVGEYATSFEMAGVSLTLLWLDDELEAAWRSPAYTAAYRKGNVTPDAAAHAADVQDQDAEVPLPAASPESVTAGRVVADAIDAVHGVIDSYADELGRLDAIAGDGDHGIGMQRGARAASSAARGAVERGAGAGSVLALAGDAWADRAGGTSGALWGAGLRVAGSSIGDDVAPDAIAIAAAVQAACAAVQSLGGAEVGDKTLVDALVPFSTTLTTRTAADVPLGDAWLAASIAASDAASATSELLPRLGRARPHTEKSLGTPDPGAVSLALAMTAVVAVIHQHERKKT